MLSFNNENLVLAQFALDVPQVLIRDTLHLPLVVPSPREIESDMSPS